MASAGSRNAKGRRRGMTIKFYDGQRYELVRTVRAWTVATPRLRYDGRRARHAARCSKLDRPCAHEGLNEPSLSKTQAPRREGEPSAGRGGVQMSAPYLWRRYASLWLLRAVSPE
jgi:hypothetical protein